MKSTAKNTLTVDDLTIWSNMKEGDENAFSLLFKKYYAELVRYGNSLCAFDDKVQDCVQDVFTDVWIYRKSVSEDIVVKAYLLSCVRKRIAKLYQKDKIFRHVSTIDTLKFLFDFSIEHQLISDETTATKVLHLNTLLNNLPSRQREALYLRYHQGLSVDQIAEMLDVNYQSANNLIFRAIQKLRKDWKKNLSILLLLSSQFT
ncbi:RNA polymerase sigma factor [Flavobacterium sp. TAB 87]|uniref:RNA polymerase sigma factor n=1 Tax=Flavobacterium sp. TAB 87 TaxID=1729581 RepID=UPI00076D6FC8|nr:sigma-70 family RNA polymerase sigma factor [Flavobacterium sp. TAB 87]KVV14167.1 RNA polymerase sigma factor [Flavobacterium sp. TAB 87]